MKSSKEIQLILVLSFPSYHTLYACFIDSVLKVAIFENLSLNNLHLFTQKGNIKKYENISEILVEWFKVRIYKYHTRKEKQLNN